MKPRLLLLLALLSPPASSHDLWIERSGTLHSLAYGHEQSSHTGVKRLEYKPESVQQARCFDASGEAVQVTPSLQYPVTLQADCAATWFLLSSGYWSKTPYGTKNLPKNEAGAVLDSWRSLEAIKRIDRWSAALARPLTQNLELVPINNPIGLKSGDKLRLHVYFQGKPAANVSVAYFGKPRGVSGADGAINIRLNLANSLPNSQPGFQHIEASLVLPLNDGKADKTVHTSSLQFEIK
jgi:nickel transport protein